MTLIFQFQKEYSTVKIKKMLSTSLRGELTDLKRQKNMFSLRNSNLVRAIAKVLKSEEAEDYRLISHTIEPVLVNSIASTVSILNLKGNRVISTSWNSSKKRGSILIALITEPETLFMWLV